MRSRRRCGVCGRTGYYEAPRIYCAHCNAVDIPGMQGSPALKIFAVMQLRNEAYYLPGCLAHLRDHVDGIIALDDGSTDATPDILDAEPKLITRIALPREENHIWRERMHQQILLEQARASGADWVLVCDADERYETGFLQHLHQIAQSLHALPLPCVQVSLKELWGSAFQYRNDGVWGTKQRDRFFRLPQDIRFDKSQNLHGAWSPDQVRENGQMVRTYHHLYHLKSIHAADRLKRRDLYKRLDPDNKYQPMGYDYLAVEDESLHIEPIASDRPYDYATLPADLRKP